ncbi:MAG: RNA recognition motif domain-containing protein [Candidatus Binataceae bacterium]
MKLFVGNLPYNVTPRELRDAFSAHVGVKDAQVPVDPHSGKSRGFGFVELISESDAQTAVDAMNNHELGGRSIRVEIAKERESARPRTIDDYRRDDRARYGHGQRR